MGYDKTKVLEKSITYSASIKKAKVKKEEELEKEIAMLEKRLGTMLVAMIRQ